MLNLLFHRSCVIENIVSLEYIQYKDLFSMKCYRIEKVWLICLSSTNPKQYILIFFAHLLILNDLNTCRQTKCNRIMTQRCYCYFLCLVHNMSILDRWKWRLLDRKLIIIFIPFFDGHALLFSFIIMLLTN